VPLPFTGEAPPHSLDLAGSSAPGEAFAALTDFLAGRPALWIESTVLVAAAVAAPYARARGPWGIAAWGTGFLAAALLAPWGAVAAFPIVLWVWLGAALLAVPVLGRRR
jgi:hypothetical protein